MDGSSYVKEAVRQAGYTFVGLSQVPDTQALPSDTSAHKAELAALNRACS